MGCQAPELSGEYASSLLISPHPERRQTEADTNLKGEPCSPLPSPEKQVRVLPAPSLEPHSRGVPHSPCPTNHEQLNVQLVVVLQEVCQVCRAHALEAAVVCVAVCEGGHSLL